MQEKPFFLGFYKGDGCCGLRVRDAACTDALPASPSSSQQPVVPVARLHLFSSASFSFPARQQRSSWVRGNSCPPLTSRWHPPLRPRRNPFALPFLPSAAGLCSWPAVPQPLQRKSHGLCHGASHVRCPPCSSGYPRPIVSRPVVSHPHPSFLTASRPAEDRAFLILKPSG